MMAIRVQSLLEPEGIDSLIRNQNLSGAMGELPVNECWPEVWIMDDDDYSRAMNIISSCLAETDTNSEPWSCVCGENIEGQFTACWKCGAERT